MNTREAIVARGLRLEYFTLGWNSLEALIALISGFVAGSIALIGFGLDSVVEVSSAAVMLWRLRADRHAPSRERAEKTALRAVGICFLVLAAYVCFEGINTLLRREAPQRSLPGILLAGASLRAPNARLQAESTAVPCRPIPVRLTSVLICPRFC
jgi:divalent metal cation (Fe/Co/Zn/Cd) transporter